MTELFLVAQVADRWVAIAADHVDSVVDIDVVVPVPRAATAVRGLAALRSRVVTVIDPRVSLGRGLTAEPQRAVVAMIEGHHYAFLVDALEDVAPFARVVESGAKAGADGWAAAGGDMIVRDGVPLLVLELAALLPAPSPAPAVALAA